MEDIFKGSVDVDNLIVDQIKSRNLKPKIKKISKNVIKRQKQSQLFNIPEVAGEIRQNKAKEYEEYNKIREINKVKTFSDILSVVVPDIAKDIMDLEQLKSKFIEEFKIAKIDEFDLFESIIEPEIVESKIAYEVDHFPLKNLTVCSVDGSFITRNFQGFDISLSRAIGVVYNFDQTGNPTITYFPDKNGIDNYKLTSVLCNTPEEEVSSQVSIDRAFLEINLVCEIINKYRGKMNMIILDGSILTEPLNMLFAQNDTIMEKYMNLIAVYKKMYKLCDLYDVLLVGGIKDTRSSTFRKLLSRRLPRILKKHKSLSKILSMNYRQLMKYFSDLDLFHRLLSAGERSCGFSINSAGNSWLPRQLELLKQEMEEEDLFMNDFEFYASYIKPVQYDFPIRLEFCMNRTRTSQENIVKKLNKISSIILPLSSKFPDFAMAIPQLEAHQRCKLNQNDMNIVMSALERKISEQIAKYTNKQAYQDRNISIKEELPNLDEMAVQNNMLISKRRDRLPL